jgi:TRAP-type mannitol/chloroaromatic compound transport system permease large subunit
MDILKKIAQLFNKLPISTLFASLLIGALAYLKGSITSTQALIYMGFVVLSVIFTESYRKFKNKKKR